MNKAARMLSSSQSATLLLIWDRKNFLTIQINCILYYKQSTFKFDESPMPSRVSLAEKKPSWPKSTA